MTDEFDGTVYATLVRRLAFSDLTVLLRALIVASAKVEFQAYLVGNDRIDLQLRDERDRARMKAAKSDQENADATLMAGDTVNAILGGTPQWGRR